jgi:hypothetical protein
MAANIIGQTTSNLPILFGTYSSIDIKSTTTVAIPSGVKTINVLVVGGGSSGGSGSDNSTNNMAGGSGGNAGGMVFVRDLDVSSLTSIYASVGAGGAAFTVESSGGTRTNVGTRSFVGLDSNTPIIIASGGIAGIGGAPASTGIQVAYLTSDYLTAKGTATYSGSRFTKHPTTMSELVQFFSITGSTSTATTIFYSTGRGGVWANSSGDRRLPEAPTPGMDGATFVSISAFSAGSGVTNSVDNFSLGGAASLAGGGGVGRSSAFGENNSIYFDGKNGGGGGGVDGSLNGGAAAPNSGAGGGGGSSNTGVGWGNGGAGGSGRVIIWYKV